MDAMETPTVKVTTAEFALALTLREQYDTAIAQKDHGQIAHVVTTANTVGDALYLRSDWRNSDRQVWMNAALGIEVPEDK